MTVQSIEAELSYAYLHAVAAKAGMSCKQGDRHDDGAGVDAEISYRGETSHEYMRHVQLNIQLKATVEDAGSHPDYCRYFMQGVNRYEKLRTDDSPIYKILVVLFLPIAPGAWLRCSPDELILKKAAYWACLYGAPATSNSTGQTVYLPKANLLTPDSLLALVDLAVHKRVSPYQQP
jgi:hypothetical protein